MGETLFALANLGVLMAASIVGWRVWRGGPPSNSCWLLTVAAWCLVMGHSAMLGLGVAGLLVPASVAIFGVVVAAVAMVWNRRLRMRAPEGPTGPSRPAAEPWGLADWIALLALAIVGSSLFLTEVWRFSGFEMWDDFYYHMTISASWLIDRSIIGQDLESIYGYHYFYPSSGDLIATWFLVPFGVSDRAETLAWVGTTGFLYWALATLAAAEALRRVGAPLSMRLLPGLLLGVAPRAQYIMTMFADVDLGLAAVVSAALVFAIPTREDRDDRRGVRLETWIAGLLAGIAVGMKVTGVLGASVIVLLCIAREARAIGREGERVGVAGLGRAAGTVLLIFLASGLATGAFWYLRNIALTGNPLFPAKLLGWEGLTFEQTRLTEFAQTYGLKTTLLASLRHFGDWPVSLGLLAAIGFVLGGAAAARRLWSSRGEPGERFWIAGALGIAALTVVVYPTLPFSAGNPPTFVVGEIHSSSFRYVTILPLLGWTALAAGLTVVLRSSAVAGQAAVGLVAVALVAFRPWAAPFYSGDWVIVASLLGAFVLTAIASTWRGGGWSALGKRGLELPRVGLVSVIAVALLVPACLLLRHEEKARMVEAVIDTNPYGGKVWEHLDRMPRSRHIAVFGRKFTFPLFGRNYQHRPISTNENGALFPTPSSHGGMDAWGAPANDLADRLIDSGVDTVLILRVDHVGEEFGWPAQKAFLEGSGLARTVYQDDFAVLYRLDEGTIAERRSEALPR
ncbi:hypothetical protein [Tautonia marina]|uniref:hypothetical protein n=1 Tax=Tautonia marina TaxID=2653855 RepID=UPI001260AC4D|nr:hypothetical protein [Tautonia marina]